MYLQDLTDKTFINNVGKLKRMLNIWPNPNIVLILIHLSESKDSSAIENNLTTYDEIFKEMASKEPHGGKSKEVINYKKLSFMDYH